MKIPSNKITCLVGESGAGKSTLLKMLNLMISPDSGDIYYQDVNVNEIEPVLHRRRVVMLAQHPTVFDGTIKENLNIGLVFSEQEPKSERELKEALKIVNLDKNLDEDAVTLSGGERQRLALARVYLMNPDVYLLDEPTAALDEDTEALVIEEFIRKAKEKGQTIIMITHSHKIAADFAEHTITIRKGTREKE